MSAISWHCRFPADAIVEMSDVNPATFATGGSLTGHAYTEPPTPRLEMRRRWLQSGRSSAAISSADRPCPSVSGRVGVDLPALSAPWRIDRSPRPDLPACSSVPTAKATPRPHAGRTACLILCKAHARGSHAPWDGDVPFTDVEGSTALREQHPGAMRAALPAHDRILRAEIEAHGGTCSRPRATASRRPFGRRATRWVRS